MPPKFFNPLPLLLLLLIAIATTTAAADAMTFQSEMENMKEALRIHGSTLFINAIVTTELQYQLLTYAAASPPAFTIFAPKDSLLYALDMISDSSTYISTLRYHVVPHRRHTFLHLQNLSSPFLQTLLPHYSLLVGKTRQSDDLLLDPDTNANTTGGVSVMVDGVRITSPDLFLGEALTVHGIDGILVTGLNMYQDFDIDDPGVDLLSSPPPSAFDYSDGAVDYYDSPTWPPAESPISSSVVFDAEGTAPPVFSDQDHSGFWDSNPNWIINGGGDANVMLDYDGSGIQDEALKKKNAAKRKRVRRGSEKRRRLYGANRQHLPDL